MSIRRVGSIAVAVVRAAVRDRVNAHAAAMSFFALLSLVPATVTLGGVLHALARIGGPELAVRAQQGAAEAIRLLIGPKLADPVINPFVQTQLTQSSGPAITGLLASGWLISRIFYSLEHGLDVTFGVADRRPSRVQRLYALGHAVIAVAVVSVTLAVMVLGWHSGHAGLDRVMGQAPVVAQLWVMLRWPLLFFILLGVIVNLYRFGPNVRLSVRQCLPGAYLAVVLWIAAAGVFRGYLLIGPVAPTGVSHRRPAGRADRPCHRRLHCDRGMVVLLLAGGADRRRTQQRAAAPVAGPPPRLAPRTAGSRVGVPAPDERPSRPGRPRLPRVIGLRAAAIGHWFEGHAR